MPKSKDTHSCSFGFEDIDGSLEIGERGEQEPSGLWPSTTLVDRQINNAGLNFLYDTAPLFAGPDRCQLEIKAFHVESSTSNRAFHGMINVYLNWQQVERLRDFCNYLLTLRTQ